MNRTAMKSALALLLFTPILCSATKFNENNELTKILKNGDSEYATGHLRQYFYDRCEKHITLSTPNTKTGETLESGACMRILGAIARILFIQGKYAEAEPYMTGIAMNSEYRHAGLRDTCKHPYYEYHEIQNKSMADDVFGELGSYDFNEDYFTILDKIGDTRAMERGYQAFLCRSLGLSNILSWKRPNPSSPDTEFLALAEKYRGESGRREVEIYLGDILPGLKEAKLPADFEESRTALAALYKSAAKRAETLDLSRTFPSFFNRLSEDEFAHLRTSIAVRNQN